MTIRDNNSERTKQDIICEYQAGDLDRMEAIEDLEKLGFNSWKAEAIIDEAEDEKIDPDKQDP